MPVCDKCGQDHDLLFYGLCSDCRKEVMRSIPILPKSNQKRLSAKQDVRIKPLIPPKSQTNLTRDDSVKWTKRMKQTMKENKAGSIILILDLIVLIMLTVSQDTLPYGTGIAVYAIAFGFMAAELEWDKRLRYLGLGILLGIILLIISLLLLFYPLFALIGIFF